MKNDNRTAPARAAQAVKAEVARLPESWASLATRAPKRPAGHPKIEMPAFSRAEMRQIVLEMIG